MQLHSVLIQFPVLLHNLRASVVWVPFTDECAYSDLPLSSAPLFLCCADSLPPTGFRSAKLQSVGQHRSATVRGLPPARQLRLARQQRQLYPGRPRGCGGTSFSGGEPPAPPQRTRDFLSRETVRRKEDSEVGLRWLG